MIRSSVAMMIALSVLCGGTDLSAQDDGDEAFLEEVRAAWQERQDRFQSFIVEWDELRTMPKETGHRDREGRPPTEDTMHTIQYRMAGEGSRLRLTRRGLVWDMDELAYMPETLVQVFDGQDRRQQFIKEYTRPHVQTTGWLNEDGSFDDGTHLQLQPVTLFFRPLTREISGIRLKDWSVSDRQGSVDGFACRILERPNGNGTYDLLWLADTADRRLLRRQLLAPNGVAYEELTLQYTQDPDWGQLCASWTYVMRNSRFNLIQQINTVHAARIQINTPVADSEFHYQFPAGTLVKYEGTSNPRRMAIALENGDLRPVTAGEISAGIPIPELMRTPPPPEVVPQDRTSAAKWILLASGLLLMVAAGIWLHRRLWVGE